MKTIFNGEGEGSKGNKIKEEQKTKRYYND